MAAIERISTTAGLERALEGSGERPLVLFKHSTRCPISSHAHDELVRFAAGLEPDRARVAIVLVVEDRAVSDEVTARLGVSHESPQALVVDGGRVRWHGSHGAVTGAALRAALAPPRS